MEIVWRIISGEGEEEIGEEKLQRIRSIIGRHKIDGGRLRMA